MPTPFLQMGTGSVLADAAGFYCARQSQNVHGASCAPCLGTGGRSGPWPGGTLHPAAPCAAPA